MDECVAFKQSPICLLSIIRRKTTLYTPNAKGKQLATIPRHDCVSNIQFAVKKKMKSKQRPKTVDSILKGISEFCKRLLFEICVLRFGFDSRRIHISDTFTSKTIENKTNHIYLFFVH